MSPSPPRSSAATAFHGAPIPDTAPSPDAMDRWNAVAYLLGELPQPARACFEDRMAADHQLCEEFLASLKLIAALSPPDSHNAASQSAPLWHQSNPSTGRRQSRKVVPAFAALAAATVAAFSLYPPEVRSTDSLRDAVALSSILANSSLAIDPSSEINSDPDSPIPHLAEHLETPGWLLTAVDLDERHSTPENPATEDDEAIF